MFTGKIGQPLPPGQGYSGRAPGMAVLNISLPREAKDLLTTWAANKKAMGAMVARLIFEERVRREERTKQEGHRT